MQYLPESHSQNPYFVLNSLPNSTCEDWAPLLLVISPTKSECCAVMSHLAEDFSTTPLPSATSLAKLLAISSSAETKSCKQK